MMGVAVVILFVNFQLLSNNPATPSNLSKSFEARIEKQTQELNAFRSLEQSNHAPSFKERIVLMTVYKELNFIESDLEDYPASLNKDLIAKNQIQQSRAERLLVR